MNIFKGTHPGAFHLRERLARSSILKISLRIDRFKMAYKFSGLLFSKKDIRATPSTVPLSVLSLAKDIEIPMKEIHCTLDAVNEGLILQTIARSKRIYEKLTNPHPLKITEENDPETTKKNIAQYIENTKNSDFKGTQQLV